MIQPIYVAKATISLILLAGATKLLWEEIKNFVHEVKETNFDE